VALKPSTGVYTLLAMIKVLKCDSLKCKISIIPVPEYTVRYTNATLRKVGLNDQLYSFLCIIQIWTIRREFIFNTIS